MRHNMSQKFPDKKIIVFMPAYKASQTLSQTVTAIPPALIDGIILCDDGSPDQVETLAEAKRLGIKTILKHERNRGYGGNLKTCLAEVVRQGADIALEIHPDAQYDLSHLERLIQTSITTGAGIVLGSRFSNKRSPRAYGMPLPKFLANKGLSFFDRLVLGLPLTEFHTGYRAYSRAFLEQVPFEADKDNYTLSFETIAQAVYFGFKVVEVPVISRYFKEAHSASLKNSTIYALETMLVLAKFMSQKLHLANFAMFKSKS